MNIGGQALAINVNDYIDTSAVVDFSLQSKNEVVALVSERALSHLGSEYLRGLIGAAKSINPSLRFELDHIRSEKLLRSTKVQSLLRSFDLVMLDGSHLAIDANMAFVRRCREWIGDCDLEVEVGCVGSTRESSVYTSPEELTRMELVHKPHLIAISVGNVHDSVERRLDLNRLTALRACTSTPLVLHGGDYLDESDLGSLHRFEPIRINIGPVYRTRYSQLLTSATFDPHDPRRALARVRNDLCQFLVEHWDKGTSAPG